MERKKILILGSTGSIGQQTIDVIENNLDLFEIVGLSCNDNVELILKQSNKLGVKNIAVANKDKYKKEYSNWFWGEDGIIEMISKSDAELVVVAISGAKSLMPTIAAIENKKDIALASKEVMVLAGQIINQKIKTYNIKVLPIDSEHSAIWQCLRGNKKRELEKVILTCSGGPFLNWDKRKFENIKIEDALNHPNWKMGKRITIDCATLMNKGLEFIEAKWLFDLRDDEIEIVIHPQSLIHSAVQYRDGAIIAQIGSKDMRTPIQYAVGFPNRLENNNERINWFDLKMNFYKPDMEKFPCLKYALEAARVGGSMPVVLNAADETAVELFLNKKIKFNEIAKVIESSLKNHKLIKNPTLEQILEVDKQTRNSLV